MFDTGQAAGQFGIVRQNRAYTHKNRIMLRTDKMGMPTRGISRDPLALAGWQSNLSIKRRSQLERDERTMPLDAGQKTRIQGAGLALKHAGMDLDPGITQKAMAAARHTRVRILKRRHDTRNAGRLQGLGAWPGLAMMGTWFKRNKSRGTTRAVASLLQRLGLRMGPAAILRPACANNMPARIDYDATHGGIGPDTPEAALRKLQRKAHVSVIRVRRRARGLRALVFGFVKLPENMLEVLGLPEIAVDGGKANIGDRIEVREPLHHKFADRR